MADGKKQRSQHCHGDGLAEDVGIDIGDPSRKIRQAQSIEQANRKTELGTGEYRCREIWRALDRVCCSGFSTDNTAARARRESRIRPGDLGEISGVAELDGLPGGSGVGEDCEQAW